MRSALLLAATLWAAPMCGQQTAGARGIEAAKRGGVVIVCRHAITDSFDEDEMTLRYDDPSTQRRLSASGERQAEALGMAFRRLKIPITEVIASPMQRTRRTAVLAFGRVILDSTWHTRGENYSGPKRQRRLAELGRPVKRGNRVIVSHIGTIYSVIPSIQGELDEGDCVVTKPDTGGNHEVVEVVSARAWLRAARLGDR